MDYIVGSPSCGPWAASTELVFVLGCMLAQREQFVGWSINCASVYLAAGAFLHNSCALRVCGLGGLLEVTACRARKPTGTEGANPLPTADTPACRARKPTGTAGANPLPTADTLGLFVPAAYGPPARGCGDDNHTLDGGDLLLS